MSKPFYSRLLSSEKTKVLLLYIFLICLIYPQVVFFGKSLLPNLYYPKGLDPPGYDGRKPVNAFNIDLGTPSFYEMPINKLVGELYLKNRLPLWNPYQGAGSPLAAQYSTKVFFPYQMLENICPWWLWDYFMLGRLVIAAFFTYLFLRLLGISLPSSFLGGVLYGLCGSLTWFINLEQFINVAMMIPICLFSLERLIRFKNRRYLAEAAVVFALMLLAGQPEISIYVMLLAFLYYFFRVIAEKPKILSLLKATLKFTGLLLLILGLSAFLILPFLEFIPNAYQCHPLGGTMGTREPIALRVAISILIPSFFELPTHYRIFPHNGVWDWVGGYSGILAFYLILLGFFYKDKHRNFFLFFSLFGFAIVLKNFGFPLIAWIGKLPLLDQSWSPRWAGPVWTFSLASAAAIALEMISHPLPKKKFLPWGILFFLLGIIGFLSYKTTYFSQLAGLSSNQLKMILPPIVGGLVVGVLILFVFAYLILRQKSRKALMYGIIFLAIFELWFYVPKGANFPWTALKLIPFLLGVFAVILLSKEKWRLGAIGIILIALTYAFVDVKPPYGFPNRYNLFSEPDYIKFLKEDKDFYRIIAGDGILMPNFSSAFRIFDIRYINSLSPRAYQNYVDRHLLKEPHLWFSDRLWFTGMPDLNKPKPRHLYQEMQDNFLYYSYLGVKYILTSKRITLNLPLVYDEDIRIYKNPHAFPRIYIAHDIKMVSDFREAQRLMGTGDIDIGNTAILEEKAPARYESASVESSNDRARIEEYTPEKIRISAEVASDGILVLTDVFYPGWKAYLDNEETRIYRVNGLVRGVFLKEGTHAIIFTYEPFSFRIGVIISAVSFLLCLALILSKGDFRITEV